jgi:FSR family fosmidomycin resistance protein-like MFS transporter
LLAALFMGGTAFGNGLGGAAADRFGHQRVAVFSLGLAFIPIYWMGFAGYSWLLFILAPLAGLLVGASQSIIIVRSQRLMPSGMALASGLTLGFMFSSGALGTLFSGYLADAYGWPIIFTITALISALGAGLAYIVTRPERQTVNPQTEPISLD